MLRRTFLASASSLVGTVGYAAATPDQQPNTESPITFDPSRTVETVAIGSPEATGPDIRPHDLHLWNDAGTQRHFSITVERPTATAPTVAVALDVPADAAIRIVLREPGDYEAAITTGDQTVSGYCEVSEARFDCNDSATQIRVDEAPPYPSQVMTTWLACGNDEVAADDAQLRESGRFPRATQQASRPASDEPNIK